METKQLSNQQEIITKDDYCASNSSEQKKCELDNQKNCKELEDEMDYWKNAFPKIYYDLGAGGI